MMTVKQILAKISQERFDVKGCEASVRVGTGRVSITDVLLDEESNEIIFLTDAVSVDGVLTDPRLVEI